MRWVNFWTILIRDFLSKVHSLINYHFVSFNYHFADTKWCQHEIFVHKTMPKGDLTISKTVSKWDLLMSKKIISIFKRDVMRFEGLKCKIYIMQ
jgi:hypothetical protein